MGSRFGVSDATADEITLLFDVRGMILIDEPRGIFVFQKGLEVTAPNIFRLAEKPVHRSREAPTTLDPSISPLGGRSPTIDSLRSPARHIAIVRLPLLLLIEIYVPLRRDITRRDIAICAKCGGSDMMSGP